MNAARSFSRGEIWVALEESLKLQSHYAKLLNMHDGGKRITFDNPAAWIARLRKVRDTEPIIVVDLTLDEKEENRP